MQLSVVGASAALLASGVPWNGPAAAVRVGWVDGKPVIAPTAEEQEASRLNLLYAGTRNRSLMIEVAAEQLPEEDLLASFRAGHEALEPLIAVQEELASRLGVKRRNPRLGNPPDEVVEAARALVGREASLIFMNHALPKAERSKRQAALRAKCEAGLQPDFPSVPRLLLGMAAEQVFEESYRQTVLEHARPVPPPSVPVPVLGSPSTGSDPFSAARAEGLHPVDTLSVRPDGRNGTSVRPLQAEVSILPVVHGSSLFARGDTQVLCTTTLGPPQIAQMLRPVSGRETEKGFFLHYEFPPYSVNETGQVGGMNRRMIGHGALAEKAVLPVLPSSEEFPYTVRVTSEVTGSDGSSSMATVCGAVLALMDAGVPIRSTVAGVSIGLVTEEQLADASLDSQRTERAQRQRQDGRAEDGEVRVEGSKFALLTDILGMEDHLGDMDFKVAGSRTGVTAVQMDIKLPGIPLSILEAAVWRAREARLHILRTMESVMLEARAELKASAPRMELVAIPFTKRGMLIGPSGLTLKRIERESGVELRMLDDSDYLQIYAPSEAAVVKAKDLISEALTSRAFLAAETSARIEAHPGASLARPSSSTLRVGDIVEAEIVSMEDFGATLRTESGAQGYLHIADAGWKAAKARANRRRPNMDELFSSGTKMRVKVTDVNGLGHCKFSRRLVEEEEGVSEETEQGAGRPANGDGGGERKEEGKREDMRSRKESRRLNGAQVEDRATTQQQEQQQARKDENRTPVRQVQFRTLPPRASEPKAVKEEGSETEGDVGEEGKREEVHFPRTASMPVNGHAVTHPPPTAVGRASHIASDPALQSMAAMTGLSVGESPAAEEEEFVGGRDPLDLDMSTFQFHARSFEYLDEDLFESHDPQRPLASAVAPSGEASEPKRNPSPNHRRQGRNRPFVHQRGKRNTHGGGAGGSGGGGGKRQQQKRNMRPGR